MFIHFIQLQLIVISFCSQPSGPSAHTPFISIKNILASMSQIIVPGLDGFGGLKCTSCSTFTPYVPVNSNKNGNKGDLFAVCRRKNSNGEQCSFFRRLSKSPSVSPALPSEPTFVSPVTQGTQASQCPVAGCGQSRIANDCQRRICRKHCVEKGGCSYKKHKAEVHTTTSTIRHLLVMVRRGAGLLTIMLWTSLDASVHIVGGLPSGGIVISGGRNLNVKIGIPYRLEDHLPDNVDGCQWNHTGIREKLLNAWRQYWAPIVSKVESSRLCQKATGGCAAEIRSCERIDNSLIVGNLGMKPP